MSKTDAKPKKSKASSNEMAEIFEAIGKMSVFGPCDVSTIQTVESEKKEKERMFRLEQERRKSEWQEMERIKKQREQEDYLYAQNLHMMLNGEHSSKNKLSRMVVGGRGIQREGRNSSPPPRRRCLPSNTSNLIAWAHGRERMYSNRRSEEAWRVRDDEEPPSTITESEEPPHRYENVENEICDNQSAFNHSNDNIKLSSSSSSLSVSPIQGESSPLQTRPCVNDENLACGGAVLRHTRCRLAPNFSNPIITDDVQLNESHSDDSDLLLKPRASDDQQPSTGKSTSSKHAFSGITSAEVFRNLRQNADYSQNFVLNNNDFPPL